MTIFITLGADPRTHIHVHVGEYRRYRTMGLKYVIYYTWYERTITDNLSRNQGLFMHFIYVLHKHESYWNLMKVKSKLSSSSISER